MTLFLQNKTLFSTIDLAERHINTHMKKHSRPEKFDADPFANVNHTNRINYRNTTFEKFAYAISNDVKLNDASKLLLLMHHISPALNRHVKVCEIYRRDRTIR